MKLSRRDLLRYSLSTAGTIYVSTALGGCTLQRAAASLSPVNFDSGVASGDPSADSIMLWTRAAGAQDGATVKVGWELALDPGFSKALRSGVASSDAARDYTIKVDVRELTPGTDYYYRFLGAGGASEVGRTRTLPVGELSELRMAVFSCANFPAGYFHAYGEASRLPAVDVFLHLGDYFYEYGDGGYATQRATELGRELAADNDGELYTLTDYRRRYALYRSDRDLQAMHAAAPMIAVWDDHEIANDTWREGAQNHSSDEGDFDTRKAAAVQAYFEWLPLRPVSADSSGRIYRSFDFGDLVSLHMLDTRLVGRDQQLEYGDFVDSQSRAMDADGFAEAMRDPARSLLGEAQREWLYDAMAESPARWQVLGQQVLMARMHMPAEVLRELFAEPDFAKRDYSRFTLLMTELAALKNTLSAGEVLSESQQERLQAVLPYNLDAWDGYPAERALLYAAARRLDKPLIVLAGDTHNAWYSELQDGEGRRVGVELGVHGVSSPGMESYLQLDEVHAQQLAGALTILIDELRYCQLSQRGYLEVLFRRDEVTARWHFFDSVTRRDYATSAHSETFSL
jgi:alkaline phosphatase D